MEIVLPAINTFIFFLLTALHLSWVFGSYAGLELSIPTDTNGRKLFRPGRLITLVVALGLLLFGLCNLIFAGWLDAGINRQYMRYGILAIAVIFLLRAVGDFDGIGFFKRRKQSAFARWDTLLYSPLCLTLAVSHWVLYISC